MNPDTDLTFSLIGSMQMVSPEILKLEQENSQLKQETENLKSKIQTLSVKLKQALAAATKQKETSDHMRQELAAKQTKILQLQTSIVKQNAENIKTLRKKQDQIKRLAKNIDDHAQQMNMLNMKIQRQTLIISEQNDLRKSFGEIVTIRQQKYLSENVNQVRESFESLMNTETMIKEGIEKMSENIVRQNRMVEQLENQLESNRLKYIESLREKDRIIQELNSELQELTKKNNVLNQSPGKLKKMKNIKMVSELEDVIRMEYEYALSQFDKEMISVEKEKIDQRLYKTIRQIGDRVVTRIINNQK